MPDTIADIIKESSEKGLAQSVGSLVNSGLTLYEQAKQMLETDERDFQRLGTNFLIPKNLNESLNIEFNKFLAEPLIRESSLLLDRCLQQRKEYQELHTKWFEACVQVDEMLRLSDLTKQEIDEIDDTQSKILQAEIDTLINQKKAANDIAKLLPDTTHILWNKESKVLIEGSYRAAVGQAWASFSYTDPSINSPGPLDTTGRILQLIKTNVENSITTQRNHDKLLFNIEKAQYSSVEQTANDNLSKTKLEVSLKDKSLKFKKDRNEVARLVAIRRAEQLTQSNGALNFFEQMKPLIDRFDNDLSAALMRLSAANEGFSLLYGDQYPYYQSFLNLIKGKTFYFDDLVTWTQLTNTWLASFLDNQQQVTRSFSLKQLINNDHRFDEGKINGTWQFRLNEEHFYTSKFVRMRSFAVQIDSGNSSGSWNVSVVPPTSALIRHSENEPQTIPQPHIGKLFLGRVNERTYAVIPEGSAPPKLYNSSPIGDDTGNGEWTFSVFNGSTSEATLNDIQDIDIHLTVALV